MKLRILVLGLVFILSACVENDSPIDPLNGQTNIFIFNGKTYHTYSWYYVYDKIGDQFQYCFLIGTTGTNVFTRNITDSYVSNGDFVRIFLQADSLSQNPRSFDILPNEYNIVSISGHSEDIVSGKITLKTDQNMIPTIEIEGKTDSGKKIILRSELNTWQIAYKLVRTVEGEFEYNSDTYEISQAFSALINSSNRLVLAVGDETDAIRSQIEFYIDKLDTTIPGIYTGAIAATDNSFTGRIIVNNLPDGTLMVDDYFNEGTLQVEQNGEDYSITFEIKTLSGRTLTGHYVGEVRQ